MFRATFTTGAIALAGLVLVGCAASSTSDQASATSTTIATSEPAPTGTVDMKDAAAKTLAIAQTVVGMSEAEAVSTLEGVSSMPITTRVVHRDGEDFAVTMDYSPHRVNLWIENGKVTQVSVG